MKKLLHKIEKSAIIIPNEEALTLLFILLLNFNLRAKLLAIEDRHEYKEVLEFFGGKATAGICLPSSYTWEEAPDVCANCLTVLGQTVGGRVRTGCPHCKSCREEVRMAVIFFTSFSKLMPEEANFILANILTKHFVVEAMQ